MDTYDYLLATTALEVAELQHGRYRKEEMEYLAQDIGNKVGEHVGRLIAELAKGLSRG